MDGEADKAAAVCNLPPRILRSMKAQPLIPWTLALAARALVAWLMEESAFTPATREIPVRINRESPARRNRP